MLNKVINMTTIDIKALIARLERELFIEQMKDDEKKKKASEQLVCSIFDVFIIILDKTRQNKVPEGLYTTVLGMIKDYWYLNKYDKVYVSNTDENAEENSNIKIKSIQVGDTTTTFADTTSQIDINGTTYNTGKIDFSEDILVEKYKKALYKHRKMGW